MRLSGSLACLTRGVTESIRYNPRHELEHHHGLKVRCNSQVPSKRSPSLKRPNSPLTELISTTQYLYNNFHRHSTENRASVYLTVMRQFQ